MALEMFTKKAMDFMSKAYKKSLAGELNKMGKNMQKHSLFLTVACFVTCYVKERWRT